MPSKRIIPNISWGAIDTVLLDMDGTLLDKHFDDHFWEHYVPQKYAEKNNLSFSTAKETLYSFYKKEAGGYNWTDIDFWANTFDLDIFGLKYDIAHLIGELPGTIDFLSFLQKMKKEIVLVTNSHPKGLALKFTRTDIEQFFTKTTCALEMRAAKEQPVFWQRLHNTLGFDKETTLLIDDNHEVLATAKNFGLSHLIAVACPSSKQLPCYSTRYPSVAHLGELIP